MTEEDQLPNRLNPKGSQSEAKAEQKVTSLTDFFDQMERAAFKRALAQRDALREPINGPNSQSN